MTFSGDESRIGEANTFSPSETGRAVVINELRYNARTPSTTPKGPLLLTAMLRCMLMAEVYTQGWSSVNSQRCCALQELGRLIKTLYLLRFIDDESYRRRILVQLNRGEGRHQLARVIFHGKRGELRQRYREGQEDQLGALGLVVNLVVLWNTIYMDAAIDQLVAEVYVVKPEDVARLSPLGFKHLNMLGRYAFTLPEFVARGELRPLRDPNATDPDDEP